MTPTARHILRLATRKCGQQGTVVIVELMNGTSVIAGGVAANADRSAKSTQVFIDAVHELLEHDVLTSVGTSQTAFRVTEDGFIIGRALHQIESKKAKVDSGI